MSNPKQTYALLHDQVLQRKGCVFSLQQFVGEHALGMIQMIHGYCKNDPREMMDGWANADQAKRDWARLVTNGQDPHSEFCQVARDLLSTYSNTLREHILDQTLVASPLLCEATNKNRKFHAGCAAIPLEMHQREWDSHTQMFIRLLNVSKSHGCESISFHICAADCIRSAQLLGLTLDHDLFS